MKAVIIFLLFFFIALFCGYTYVTGNGDAEKGIDFEKTNVLTLNSLYVFMATLGWKSYSYEGVTLKYPSDWQEKDFDLGKGKMVRLLKAKSAQDVSGIIFGTMDHSSFSSCDDMVEQAKGQTQMMQEGFNNSNNPPFSAGSYKETDFELHDFSGKFILTNTGVSNYQTKALEFCFEKNGKEYGGELTAPGSGDSFADLKVFKLFLNSL